MTTEFFIYAIGVIVLWFVAWRLPSVTARQLLYLVASCFSTSLGARG